MRVAGIDIGSRTVKLALMDGGTVVHAALAYNTHDPMEVCRNLLEGQAFERIVATGYGRGLFARHWSAETITEIRAAGAGGRLVEPACRTILDIGGQDTKALSLDESGRVRKFTMNDRCAAGTGRFLEVMASALSYSMPEFVAAASDAAQARKLNSMCTVFAESEVVSLVACGTPRDELALGIHQSVAVRSVALLRGIPVAEPVLFVGGAARNTALRRLLAEYLGCEIRVPENPQVVAAIGCAFHGGRI
jgi:(R)-2-hydroxyacyl-CoA dehydratese activating ATPase